MLMSMSSSRFLLARSPFLSHNLEDYADETLIKGVELTLFDRDGESIELDQKRNRECYL